MVDINTTGNGFFTFIETKEEFILKFGETLIGPFDNTEAEKNRIVKLMDGLKTSSCKD
ncbi:Uncharacterised protein [Lysinibacillus capsici]|uniref:Uncharacterized protein n=1 Tax=Lysinibacillus capsici TaxID=2115968 RepID=A0A2X1A8K3_9BACI|nr:Uncharacterised protein [Lysinibacillus capsici]